MCVTTLGTYSMLTLCPPVGSTNELAWYTVKLPDHEPDVDIVVVSAAVFTVALLKEKFCVPLKLEIA